MKTNLSLSNPLSHAPLVHLFSLWKSKVYLAIDTFFYLEPLHFYQMADHPWLFFNPINSFFTIKSMLVYFGNRLAVYAFFK